MGVPRWLRRDPGLRDHIGQLSAHLEGSAGSGPSAHGHLPLRRCLRERRGTDSDRDRVARTRDPPPRGEHGAHRIEEAFAATRSLPSPFARHTLVEFRRALGDVRRELPIVCCPPASWGARLRSRRSARARRASSRTSSIAVSRTAGASSSPIRSWPHPRGRVSMSSGCPRM